MLNVAEDCERYAKIIEGIKVVAIDWQEGDPERQEPRETLLKAAAFIRQTLASERVCDQGRGDEITRLNEVIAAHIDHANKLHGQLVKEQWREIDSATPTDRFILMWCREDDSYWWAKWQGGVWHGVDEHGLTRDSENFTPDYWREIPAFTDEKGG